MKIALVILFLTSCLSNTLIASELVVYFEERQTDVLASCDKSTYILKAGELNEQFLIDKVIIDGRPQQRGDIKAIFNSNVSFKSYFFILSHLSRVGYENLKIYILSDDKKSMMPFEIKSLGISERAIQKP